MTSLQAILLSAAPGTASLCWRHVAADPASGPCTGDAVPVLRPGDTLRLDTFLNCFYECYWRALTRLAAFAVEVVASGPCTVRLVRSSNGRAPETVGEVASAGERTVTTLPVPLDPSGGGVLHVEVQAGSGAVELHAGRWTTPEPRANPVALTIAICSFGRDDMVAVTLEGMAEVAARCEAIREVVVVHQGATDLAAHPSILDLLRRDRFGGKLRIVRQPNFGGSGGFARGMIEALEVGATHVLLMDDDVRLEASVLCRLTALLSYLANPTTLGGQMLDLHRPAMLYASHEHADPGTMRLANPCKSVDLGAAGAIRLFETVHESDYAAWWFCCIPTDVIREAGLPLPVFIRHDDVEHGVRTVRSGRPLVTVPGLFVWHEAFEAKAKSWQVYYERRNMLILSALHGRASAPRQAIVFLREAWIGLAMGRYDYCWAVCRAAEDYLEGPETVFADAVSRHQTILAETARHMLQALHDFRLRGARESAARLCRSHGRARLTLALLRSLARRDRSASLRRGLALSVLRMTIGLSLSGARAAARYRGAAGRYSTVSFWSGALGLPTKTTA